MNGSPTAKPPATPDRFPHERPPISPAPLPGQLWTITGVPGHSHGVYLGDGAWKILVRNPAGEYSLAPAFNAVPEELSPVQPAGPHWADEFDALAAAGNLPINWADEILSYQLGALEILGRR